jgi:multidrug efflux pump subunit AcrA (membrane-fusion protein)
VGGEHAVNACMAWPSRACPAAPPSWPPPPHACRGFRPCCWPVPACRERLEEQQQATMDLQSQLAAAAGASASPEKAPRLAAEVEALRQRWQQAEAEAEAARCQLAAARHDRGVVAAEAAALRQQLQQREAQVAQLRLQACRRWPCHRLFLLLPAPRSRGLPPRCCLASCLQGLPRVVAAGFTEQPALPQCRCPTCGLNWQSSSAGQTPPAARWGPLTVAARQASVESLAAKRMSA